MRLRYGRSYWLQSGRSSAHYPRHRGHLDVDVAIVGGGFTGCAAAYVFAAAGVRVALFERGKLGCGSAAASTALLMQEPDQYFAELADRYGRSIARAIWRSSSGAVRDLTSTLRRFDCGLRFQESLHIAADGDGARELRDDLRARRNAGLPGRLLDEAGLKRKTGANGTAAILTSGNAVVDPYRATLALANAAERLGARIFESSRAGRVTGSRDGVSLRTPQGTVRCRHVVIATGSATPAFTPLLSRFRVSSTYVLATQPLPAGLRRQMRAGRVMFWDAERPYHYFRWTDDGRIVFGGGDRPVPRGRRARHAALVEGVASLKAKLCGFYPQLDAVKVSCAWDGLFATTPDALPYIGPHRRYPRHLFALGYGGNGMTFGFLAARILLRHCLGRAHPSDSLFRFSRF